jgi:hypothetical protein
MSSSSPKDPFAAKFEELDHQSQALLDTKKDTSSSVVRYNYAIRKKELENQHEECLAKQASTETEFKREQELKKLDIRLKEQEERAYDHQIELLHLQIQYQYTMAPHAPTAGSSFAPPLAAPPGPSFDLPFVPVLSSTPSIVPAPALAPAPAPAPAPIPGPSFTSGLIPVLSTTPSTALPTDGGPHLFLGSSSSRGGVY